jgi:predicted porin
MNKNALALAVLATACAQAQAQNTNVTMFGVFDAAVRYSKSDGAAVSAGSKLELAQSGNFSSRWGVRGSEALGGGLTANFWLESSLANDDSTGFSLNNNRRSYVGLKGGFGEFKLGREYTPWFVNHSVYDVFGTNGIGGLNNVTGWSLIPTTFVRANNSISYEAPAGIPVIVQAMYALGEQTSGGNNPNKNQGNAYGARVGGAFGPAEIALGYGVERGAGAAKFTDTSIGGKVALGKVSLMGMHSASKDNTTVKRNNTNVGAAFALGSTTLKASYTMTKQKNPAVVADANQIALGAVHELSKRTAIYGTLAIVDNKNVATIPAANYRTTGQRVVSQAGGGTKAFEFGLRHSF